jgi:hypothetical protein
VPREPESQLAGAAGALGLGWSLGWRIAAGLIAGYYLDAKLGTSPFLTLLLSITAMVVGVRQILGMLGRRSDDAAGEDGSS